MSRMFAYFSVMLAIFLSGCQGQHEKIGDPNKQVILIGTKHFPASLAGTWRSEEEKVEVTLDKNGRLKEAVITPGWINVTPNHTTTVEMKNGSMGIYQVGDCPVTYIKESNELTVEINVERIYIPFPSDHIEGSVKQVFVGHLNPEMNEWQATWFNLFDYGPRLPMDPNGLGSPITFIKKQS